MEFNESGTINVTIEYTDLNGTTVEEGSVFPDRTNTMRVEYIGGSSMTITIGTINGESGSLSMESTGIRAETAWTVVLPQVNATKKTGYEYDAMINYTQGPVNIFRRIGK
jgi:hypothetical protein